MFSNCRDRLLATMLQLNTQTRCCHGNIQVHTYTHTDAPATPSHPHTLTDQDMGYGPSMLSGSAKKGTVEQSLHPPPPPVTHQDGSTDPHEVLTHDNNFIMAKRTDDGSTIRKVPTLVCN